MEASDHDLLRQFAAQRSEDAFRQLVHRHVGMVFSVARRVTDDPQLAEEVAQSTFTTLAQKAGELGSDDVPAGWLYHTARHLALRAVRSEQRRQQREQIAAAMNTDEPGPSVVAEHLESAMDQLPPADRDALVLRFFEDRNLRDVGHELGLTEDAARMRVNRALEKLRGVFGKLGITASAAWLASTLTLTTGATATVPAGLGASIATAVLGGTAVVAATATIVTQTTTTTMNLINLKTAAAIVAAAAVSGTATFFVQERETHRLRADYQLLNETRAGLAAEQTQALAMIKLRDEQLAALKRDAEAVHRLRAEVDRLNREMAALSAVHRENERMKLELEKLAASLNQSSEGRNTLIQEADVKEREALVARLYEMRQVGLGQIMFADDNDGWFPQTLTEAAPYLKITPQNVELLFMGREKDLREAARTLVARDALAQTRSDGRFVRSYTFADGHTEVHAADTMQELAAWETERIIPRELWSKRP